MTDAVDSASGDNMTTDPVCGARLRPDDAVASAEYSGRVYYFQHIKCKMLFEREPEKYAADASSPTATAPLAAPCPDPSEAPAKPPTPRLLGLGVGVSAVIALGVGVVFFAGSDDGSAPAAVEVTPPATTAEQATDAAPGADTLTERHGEEHSIKAAADTPANAVDAVVDSAAATPTPSAPKPSKRSRSPRQSEVKSPEEHPTPAPDAKGNYELGNRCLADNKLKAAVTALKTAIKMDAGFAEAYAALGIAYSRLGKDKLAVEAFMTYLKLAPTGTEADRVRKLIEAQDQRSASVPR